jgi:hypothetical protein
MRIYCIDEYESVIYDGESASTPRIGESIFFADNEYKIKDVTWHLGNSTVVISVSQTEDRIVQEKDTSVGRLNEINNAIIALNKKHKTNEEVITNLSDQVSFLKKTLKQKVYQDNKAIKEKNDNR